MRGLKKVGSTVLEEKGATIIKWNKKLVVLTVGLCGDMVVAEKGDA